MDAVNNNNPPGVAVWATVNLALLFLAVVAWGWLDHRYVAQFWTPDEMRQATDWLTLGIAAIVMSTNLWLLRKYSIANHLLGALGSAVAITALWWAIVALAGNAFHTAIGGT